MDSLSRPAKAVGQNKQAWIFLICYLCFAGKKNLNETNRLSRKYDFSEFKIPLDTGTYRPVERPENTETFDISSANVSREPDDVPRITAATLCLGVSLNVAFTLF
ncbi:MAG: hypothetical protein HOB72_23070 [Rhodospirillaceae bacterium]|nr:hypothetical protein [Rhodospirillaceae bacterium]